MTAYLSSTWFLDYESAPIQEWIGDLKTSDLSEQEKAVACYLKVRDGWRYNPYQISFKKEYWKASEIIQRAEGHCIDKSILLVVGLRALNIPARLHLAKVKNHIAVERLIEKLGTNELTPHGMVDLYINDKWLKASPAFNASLCEKCDVAPLEFDGQNDSIFQEYNREGKAFMEYLEDYGHFADLPFNFIVENLKHHYPKWSQYLLEQD